MSKAPKKIETLEQDIKNLLTEVQKGQDPSKPNAWITPEALSSFGVQSAVAIDRQFHRVHKERKPNTIYASELGIKCPRKIWYKHNSTPADGIIKVYPPNVITKFMYGDMVEGIGLLLVEAAGHRVTHRQHPIKLNFLSKGDEWQVSGKIDAIIDDTALVDVKSTTSFGFKDFTSGTGGDKFGYREQLSYYQHYSHPLPVKEAGYLAIDKGLGHIAYCPERTYSINHIVDLAERYAETTRVLDVDSFKRMDTVEHSAGNFKLGTECSYCVAPESLILTGDLRWVRADSLNVGDGVLGFEEHLTKHTKFKHGVVTNTSIIQADRYKIVTDKGDVIVSADHKLVSKAPAGGVRTWRKPSQIKENYFIQWLGKPWETDTSWEGGWLSGFLDGEGTFHNNALSYAQNPGKVSNFAKELLDKRGHRFSVRKSTNTGSPCETFRTLGGHYAGYSLVGSIRPQRLLQKAVQDIEGLATHSTTSEYAKVLEVVPLGIGPVVGLETSTKTYLSNGFFSHNCEYKHECWKNANGGKGIRSFAYAGKVVDLVVVSKEPKVPEITRELDTIDE